MLGLQQEEADWMAGKSVISRCVSLDITPHGLGAL
jgi:hypothetical protein